MGSEMMKLQPILTRGRGDAGTRGLRDHRVTASPRLRVLFAPLLFAAALLFTAAPALAQRAVSFPPAESKPPPPAKSPPRAQSSGEDTGVLPDFGPAQRKTQDRTPPPPPTLTIMYKVQYGEQLQYTHPDGTVQKFDQWQSFPADGSNLVSYTNQRLADGNNYLYAT